MPDAYGPMMLKSNGMSYMGFDLGLVAYDIKSGKIAKRLGFLCSKLFQYKYSIREDLGTWSAGIPGKMMFKPGMEDEIIKFRAKTVYRVVTVIQPPFMMWNDTTSKYGRPKAALVSEEDLELFLIFRRFSMNMANISKPLKNK